MKREWLKGFVLMQVYDRLLQLLEEYYDHVHPALEELNDVTQEIYEKIFVKVREEFPLNEKEAHELYIILKDAYEENGSMKEFCYQSCAAYCFPRLKNDILEQELQNNYMIHSNK